MAEKILGENAMRCRICGNENLNHCYAAREMMFGFRDEFEYFQCSECDCLQISDYPVDVAKYYGDSYYSYQAYYHKNSFVNELIRQILKLRDEYEVSNKGFIGKILSLKRPNPTLRLVSAELINKDISILEVGCGGGRFLHSLHKLGFCNLTGLDPYITHDLIVGDGFSIYKKELKNLSGKYDLIFFQHSLEHMPQQASVFNSISDLLSENGVCIIRIPICESFAWKHYGINWVGLDAPRHYYLHSTRSLGILAENAGFNVSKIIYDSTAMQFWGSEQYVRDIPLRDKRSLVEGGREFSRLQLAEFERKAEELNIARQGDQAAFFLTHAD